MHRKSPYEPEAVEVTSRDGVPVAVTVKKRRMPVRDVLNVWRIDEEWWRTPITRLYFLLQLDSGVRVTVFHDLENNGWYRQNWAATIGARVAPSTSKARGATPS